MATPKKQGKDKPPSSLEEEVKRLSRALEVEAALEKVRNGAMSMRTSAELAETSSVLFHSVKELGIDAIRASVGIFDDANDAIELWLTTVSEGEKVIRVLDYVNLHIHPVFESLLAARRKHKPYSLSVLKGPEVKNYYKTMSTYMSLPAQASYNAEECYYSFLFAQGSINVIVTEELSDEECLIMGRFANAFGLIYTRFLDLQKAEAQTREAQIEVALERIRARTMAMQNSNELAELVSTLFHELIQLGFSLTSCNIWIHNSETQENDLWVASSAAQLARPIRITPFYGPFFQSIIQAWKANDPRWSFVLEGKDKSDFVKSFFKAVPDLPEEMKSTIKALERLVFSASFNSLGAIEIVEQEILSDEKFALLHRFGKVFELGYTRFNDLKKAEAQAREAKIEAVLEKIRAVSMAMHKSDELQGAINAIISGLNELAIDVHTAQILIYKDNPKGIDYWTASSTVKYQGVFWVPRSEIPYTKALHDARENRQDLVSLSYAGIQKNEIFQYLFTETDYRNIPEERKKFIMESPVAEIAVAIEGDIGVQAIRYISKPYSQEEISILHRLCKVFKQTYTRFLDLLKAEDQALDAVKRASVDRLRAEIASMRSTKDLERIAPLIWSELTTLGVPFVRCGLHIMDEEKQLIYNYLSTPDGKAISTADGKQIAFFQFPYPTSGFFERVLKQWQERKVYKEHLDKSSFAEIATTMVQNGVFATEQQYLSTLTHSDLDAHFLPFLQGMLYVANTAPLSEDQLELVQSLADAFSTAYARYEDFHKLESAKVQIERTLADLKQTQTQLVQSEKMASLGELTAGIAHEIQNPLNFVNNFSEVSKELLDEMKAELATGNWQPATELAESVIQNLEKINFHGKRADGIVKSMLQHSRKSTGQKEPTDINALCDEYLRLSYHGLRAKDKSFNAKFETDLDPSVGSLSVLPQEIGRVILNLINNAFYAVSEKKKLNLDKYEPTVTVTTKKTEKNIEVRIKDNGIGVPQKLLDKIFNPFFTTKPTGQGTGLGLSLSYDIITKGHGGELKVVTKEGEGSEFIVQLPIV